MFLKERIEHELRTARPGTSIEKLLAYMDRHGYYTCCSTTHNSWKGGAAEHMWTCYQIAKLRKCEILTNKPQLLKYATDEKLAIVCLLHDLCDMKHITVKKNKEQGSEDVSDKHGEKSYWILRNHKVGTIGEQYAVRYHMHRDVKTDLRDKNAKEEYEALHTIICAVDHLASGVAWNSKRFKEGKTQHSGVHSYSGYLRSVALDRTKQCLENHVYLDSDMCLHTLKGYNRDNIMWNSNMDIVQQNCHERADIKGNDAITELHRHIISGNKYCLILGVDSSIPQDVNKRLRNDWRSEQDLLICSNLLSSLYLRDKRTVTEKQHHYGFTMHDEIKQHYREQSSDRCIFLPDVTFFRDGASEGFRMVEPWKCDVMLIPGWKGMVHVSMP